MLESLILNKKVEELYLKYKEEGMLEIIETMSQYVNKRSYFKIENNVKIKAGSNSSFSNENGTKWRVKYKQFKGENFTGNYYSDGKKFIVTDLTPPPNSLEEIIQKIYYKTERGCKASFYIM